jgi:thioesterase domain-containing protein
MHDKTSITEILATLARLGVCIRRLGRSLDYRAHLGAANEHVARYIDRHRPLLLDTCREITAYDDVLFPLAVTPNANLNVICLHPISGNVFDYRYLAAELDGECSVFGVQAHHWFVTGKAPASSSDMVSFYASRLGDHPVTRSPFVLYGASAGGCLALEISTILAERGRYAELVILGDTRDPIDVTAFPNVGPIVKRLKWISFVALCLPLPLLDIGSSRHEFWRLSESDRFSYLVSRSLLLDEPMCFAPLQRESLTELYTIFDAYSRALAHQKPRAYSGPAAFLATSDAPPSRTEGIRGKLIGRHSFHRIVGSHIDMLREAGAGVVAEIVRNLPGSGGTRKGRRSALFPALRPGSAARPDR